MKHARDGLDGIVSACAVVCVRCSVDSMSAILLLVRLYGSVDDYPFEQAGIIVAAKP